MAVEPSCHIILGRCVRAIWVGICRNGRDLGPEAADTVVAAAGKWRGCVLRVADTSAICKVSGERVVPPSEYKVAHYSSRCSRTQPLISSAPRM